MPATQHSCALMRGYTPGSRRRGRRSPSSFKKIFFDSASVARRARGRYRPYSARITSPFDSPSNPSCLTKNLRRADGTSLRRRDGRGGGPTEESKKAQNGLEARAPVTERRRNAPSCNYCPGYHFHRDCPVLNARNQETGEARRLRRAPSRTRTRLPNTEHH